MLVASSTENSYPLLGVSVNVNVYVESSLNTSPALNSGSLSQVHSNLLILNVSLLFSIDVADVSPILTLPMSNAKYVISIISRRAAGLYGISNSIL